jgi:hypothetical protein
MKNKMILVGVLLVISMALTACPSTVQTPTTESTVIAPGGDTTPAPTPDPTPNPNPAPDPTPDPTPTPDPLPSGPDTCKNGFVWREVIPSDHVCVTGSIRTQTANENTMIDARRSPTGGAYGIDTCKNGFVWREAFVGDNVCVPGASRDQAASDNAAARSRFVVAHDAPVNKLAYGIDTCKNGYVWRDAIPDDRVCVTGTRRSAVAAENALATDRRSPTGGAYGLDTCKNGFVWREAFQGDNVCVPGTSRDLSVTENNAARGLFVIAHTPPKVSLAYGLDTCKNSFVWRETVPNDHVCVSGARRDAVATENALAADRRSPTGGAFGPDTCLNGFVWREASSTDHVCVPGDSRTLVAQENGLARDRFVIAHDPIAF